MREGGRERRQQEEQRALEPAADPARLDQEPGQHGHGRLNEDVSVPDVNQFVGNDPLELRGLGCCQEPGADRERRAVRPTARCKGSRMGVCDQIQPRARDADAPREALNGRLEERSFGSGQLARFDHSGRDPVQVPVERGRRQQRAEERDRRDPVAADQPAETPDERAEAKEQEPRLEQVPRRREEAHWSRCRARPRRTRAEASPAPARRSGSCSGARRCSGAG